MKKQNLKNKIDRLAGILILLNFIIIGAPIAGFVFGFRFESGKEVLMFLIPLFIIVAITAAVLEISKEGD